MISWLRFGETPLDPDWIFPGIRALDRMLDDLVIISHPSTNAEVSDVIHLIASTVQVAVPEEMGAKVYMALLGRLPRHVLELAAIEILKTHKIRVLPLPAELLATEAVREWDIVSVSWPRLVLDWRRRLVAALPPIDQPRRLT